MPLNPPLPMDLTYKCLLFFHAGTGGLALISGIFAAIYRKGSQKHTTAGRFFAVFMLASAISALVLASLKPNPFLLGIGLFTIYMVSSGWVWIRRTVFHRKVKTARLIGIGGLMAAGYMVYVGLGMAGGGIVLFVFSVFLSAMAATDVFRKVDRQGVARLHAGRMGGAFIASVTAFLVTNFHLAYPLVLWLAPTVVGTPLIVLGIRKFYGKKKKNNQSA